MPHNIITTDYRRETVCNVHSRGVTLICGDISLWEYDCSYQPVWQFTHRYSTLTYVVTYAYFCVWYVQGNPVVPERYNARIFKRRTILVCAYGTFPTCTLFMRNVWSQKHGKHVMSPAHNRFRGSTDHRGFNVTAYTTNTELVTSWYEVTHLSSVVSNGR